MKFAAAKILVIRGGAIGDFILTLPVLAALREHFPHCSLEVLGYPHIAQLAVAGGLVDAVRSIEARALAGFFAQNGDLDDALADYFAGFALIVSFLYDPDGIFRENVARCSPAQFVAGPHRPDESLELHATDTFFRPLERLAIFAPTPAPRLDLTAHPGPGLDFDSSSRDSATLPGPGCCAASNRIGARITVALHPGSGSEDKNWPQTHWAAFVRQLVDTIQARLLLVGGESEGDRLDQLARLVPPERLTVAWHRPLVELACLLQRCQAYVGHDSGISHLAAAVGLPGLILWGHSNETVWRPRSERMRILRAPGGLAALEVADVLASLRQLLAMSNPT